MGKNRLLIAEDDLFSAEMMKDFLEIKGYEVSTASNGREALDLFEKEPFPVIITDIEMPEMDGNALISHLKAFLPEPVIIVETAHNDPPLIIDIMKKGVFDYLLKPIDMNDLLIKTDRAFEVSEMKRAGMLLEKEKIIRLENQLEWYRWEERMKTRGSVQTGKTLLESLRTSFNQGYGFGSLVTLIELLSSSAVKKDDSYIINAELFDVLKENSKMSAFAIQAFGDISDILSGDLDLETVSADFIYDFIKDIIRGADHKAEIKNQRIILGDKKIYSASAVYGINKPHLEKAFYEVLMNAFKFSEEESSVLVFINVDEESLVIDTLSTPKADSGGRRGIPAEYENIVFEPFFRLSKSIQEQYKTLDFGLGLSVVEAVISKHGGKTSICNIIDHSNLSKGPASRVKFSITLPRRH